MEDCEAKARSFLAEAEKKTKKGFFSFGSSYKTEEAIGLYENAANSFKMAHKWIDAGNAFCEAANLSLQVKSKHDAATHFSNAAIAYKKDDLNKAIECLTRVIEIYTEMGKFIMVAKNHTTIAEICEKDLCNYEKAIMHYEQAGNYYKGEDSNVSGTKCDLAVAHLAAQLGQVEKAADLFEKSGKISMESPLGKYSARTYFFKAAICHFLIDLINGKKALKSYEESYPMFADSRECNFMKKIAESLEQENVEMFTAAVQEYDSITRLDNWLVARFNKLKKTLAPEEDIN